MERKTNYTYEEKLQACMDYLSGKRSTKEIVQYCLDHNKDDKGTASKYGCSYAQVYQWVRNYETKGAESLADNRITKYWDHIHSLQNRSAA